MEITLETKQQLAGLLAKPATVTQADSAMLTALIKTYPYYQPLHLLLAKANLNDNNNSHLATAALYNGGGLLHKVVYQAESLVPKPINLVAIKSATNTTTEEAEPVLENQVANEEPTEVDFSSTTSVDPDEQEIFDEIAEIAAVPTAEANQQEEKTVEQPEESNPDQQTDNPADEQETFDEITEIAALPQAEASQQKEKTAEQPEELNPDQQTQNPADEQETFDEITEIAAVPQAEASQQKEKTAEQPEEFNPEQQTDNPADEQETFDEITEIETLPTAEANLQEEKTAEQPEEFNPDQQTDNPADEQETFDEITEITTPPTTDVGQQKEETDQIEELNPDLPAVQDIDETANLTENEHIDTEKRQLDDEDVFDEIAEVDSYISTPEAAQTDEKLQSEKQLLSNEFAIESIVAMDFFAFEKSSRNNQISPAENKPQTNIPQPEEYNSEAEAQTISKYDDDKLPYTFLWWLAKTRKEHEQIFQPYVTAKRKNNSISGELQQQYIEHIFHLQTPFNTQDETNRGPLNRQISHKGNEIIETFIKNEPQIRVPKPDQINNENKAKKSAEDNYDLVSETLASIYIEQTLYHKAIDTYEKLSLKFPEKSRYFADLIQSLEKKI